jgi:hypothetical protein
MAVGRLILFEVSVALPGRCSYDVADVKAIPFEV